MTEKNSNQITSLVQRPGLEFKFHFLLDCSTWRMTTVGHDPLKFITITQDIVQSNGKKFKHDLTMTLWGMLQNCKSLGDMETKMVLVPTDENLDWKTRTPKEKANLFVRVVEVGSDRLGLTALHMAEREYAYWQRLQKEALSEPMVLESCGSSWTEAVGFIHRKLVEARGNCVEVWVNSPKIE